MACPPREDPGLQRPPVSPSFSHGAHLYHAVFSESSVPLVSPAACMHTHVPCKHTLPDPTPCFCSREQLVLLPAACVRGSSKPPQTLGLRWSAHIPYHWTCRVYLPIEITSSCDSVWPLSLTVTLLRAAVASSASLCSRCLVPLSTCSTCSWICRLNK